MDQSISLMGELGKAKRVDFVPLRAVPVPLPPGACFVIANTLVTSDKQGERGLRQPTCIEVRHSHRKTHLLSRPYRRRQ